LFDEQRLKAKARGAAVNLEEMKDTFNDNFEVYWRNADYENRATNSWEIPNDEVLYDTDPFERNPLKSFTPSLVHAYGSNGTAGYALMRV
jgi:hypothetical protein